MRKRAAKGCLREGYTLQAARGIYSAERERFFIRVEWAIGGKSICGRVGVGD